MPSSKNLTANELAALTSIEAGDALAKVIASKVSDWDFLLDQMVDPNQKRPKDLTGLGKDGWRYHPKTKAKYFLDPNRDKSKKTYTHTKKTAISLLPGVLKQGAKIVKNAGRMFLFGTSQQYGIGLLFDVNECDLKEEKYLFKEEATTFAKWWKEAETQDNRRDSYQSSPIQEIKTFLLNQLKKQKKPLDYSELMVGVNKKGLRGVFFQARTHGISTISRKAYFLALFDAIRKKILVENKLNIANLPIIILNADTGVTKESVYTEEQQRQDLLRFKAEFGEAQIQDLLDELTKQPAPATFQPGAGGGGEKGPIAKMPNFKIEVYAEANQAQYLEMSTFRPSDRQIHLIEQYLIQPNNHYKPLRDHLISRLPNAHAKKFYRLVAEYRDVTYKQEKKQSVLQRNRLKKLKTEMLSVIKQAKVTSASENSYPQDPFLADYLKAYYYFHISNKKTEGLAILTKLMARNIPLSFELYANVAKPESLQPALINRGVELGSPTYQLLAHQSYLDNINTYMTNWVAASLSENDWSPQSQVVTEFEQTNLEQVRSAVSMGNDQAISKVSLLLNSLLQMFSQKRDLPNTVAYLIQIIDIVTADKDLVSRLNMLAAYPIEQRILWVEDLKKSIADYPKTLYQKVHNSELIAEVNYQQKYNNKLSYLFSLAKIVADRGQHSLDATTLKIVKNLQTHLDLAEMRRRVSGHIAYPETQLQEIEETLVLYEKVVLLQEWVDAFKAYRNHISNDSSIADGKFKETLIRNESAIKEVLSAIKNAILTRTGDVALVEENAKLSLLSILTAGNQLITPMMDQFKKDRDIFYREKLKLIQSRLSNHQYELNGGIHGTLKHKKVSKTAKEVDRIIGHFLSLDIQVTSSVWEKIRADIQAELRGKTDPTKGFGYFCWGARDLSTAQLYRAVLQDLDQPIKVNENNMPAYLNQPVQIAI